MPANSRWDLIRRLRVNFAVGSRDSKTSEKGRLVNEKNLEKRDRDPISEKPTISAYTWNLGKPRKNTDQISPLLAEI